MRIVHLFQGLRDGDPLAWMLVGLVTVGYLVLLAFEHRRCRILRERAASKPKRVVKRMPGMTVEGFDRLLSQRGWRYDAMDGEFYDECNRTIEWEEVIGVVPGMTLDELAWYRDAKIAESRSRCKKS
jgi:hypothetical protein